MLNTHAQESAENTNTESGTSGAKAREREDLTTRFGYLPNRIGRDPTVSAAELVALAYASIRIDWTLNPRDMVNRLWQDKERRKRTGGGRSAMKVAIASIRQRGLVSGSHDRRTGKRTTMDGREIQRLETARGARARFRSTRGEQVVWIEGDDKAYGTVQGRWFDASLTMRQVAILTYLAIGAGNRPYSYANEIEDRFGWSRDTVADELKVLRQRRSHLVIMEASRAGGRFQRARYRVAVTDHGDYHHVGTTDHGRTDYGTAGHIQTTNPTQDSVDKTPKAPQRGASRSLQCWIDELIEVASLAGHGVVDRRGLIATAEQAAQIAASIPDIFDDEPDRGWLAMRSALQQMPMQIITSWDDLASVARSIAKIPFPI